MSETAKALMLWGKPEEIEEKQTAGRNDVHGEYLLEPDRKEFSKGSNYVRAFSRGQAENLPIA